MTSGHRGHQGVWTNQLGFDLRGRTRGHRHHQGIRAPELDAGLFALPNGRRCNGLTSIKKLDGIKCGVTPVEQFLRLIGTRNFTAGAQHNGHQAAGAKVGEVTFGCGHQAITCRIGMARFQTVDGWVFEKQQIAIAFVGCGSAWVTVFFDGVGAHVVRKIAHQTHGQGGQVACRGDMARLRQTFWVFVGGVFHAQHFGLVVHHLHKAID